MIQRTAICGACGAKETEDKFGEGFKQWIQIQGIQLDGDANPHFCPECTKKIMDYVDKMVDK